MSTEQMILVLELAQKQLEEWEKDIEFEWGCCRSLEELEKEGSLSDATLAVRAALEELKAEKAARTRRQRECVKKNRGRIG